MTINALFFSAVSTAAGEIPVAYPNIDYNGDSDYYRVSIMPTQAFALGIDNTNIKRGICQVSCFVRDGVGEISALTMSETIIEAFERGTVLSDGTTKVRIDSPAWVSAGLQSGSGWYMIPVSIPFYSIY